MSLTLLSDVNTSTPTQNRRRVHLLAEDNPNRDAIIEGIKTAVNRHMGRADVVLVHVYGSRQAVDWNGWIAKGLFQNGRLQISFGNDPALRRALFREYAE